MSAELLGAVNEVAGIAEEAALDAHPGVIRSQSVPPAELVSAGVLDGEFRA